LLVLQVRQVLLLQVRLLLERQVLRQVLQVLQLQELQELLQELQFFLRSLRKKLSLKERGK